MNTSKFNDKVLSDNKLADIKNKVNIKKITNNKNVVIWDSISYNYQKNTLDNLIDDNIKKVFIISENNKFNEIVESLKLEHVTNNILHYKVSYLKDDTNKIEYEISCCIRDDISELRYKVITDFLIYIEKNKIKNVLVLDNSNSYDYMLYSLYKKHHTNNLLITNNITYKKDYIKKITRLNEEIINSDILKKISSSKELFFKFQIFIDYKINKNEMSLYLNEYKNSSIYIFVENYLHLLNHNKQRDLNKEKFINSMLLEYFKLYNNLFFSCKIEAAYRIYNFILSKEVLINPIDFISYCYNINSYLTKLPVKYNFTFDDSVLNEPEEIFDSYFFSKFEFYPNYNILDNEKYKINLIFPYINNDELRFYEIICESYSENKSIKFAALNALEFLFSKGEL